MTGILDGHASSRFCCATEAVNVQQDSNHCVLVPPPTLPHMKQFALQNISTMIHSTTAPNPLGNKLKPNTTIHSSIQKLEATAPNSPNPPRKHNVDVIINVNTCQQNPHKPQEQPQTQPKNMLTHGTHNTLQPSREHTTPPHHRINNIINNTKQSQQHREHARLQQKRAYLPTHHKHLDDIRVLATRNLWGGVLCSFLAIPLRPSTNKCCNPLCVVIIVYAGLRANRSVFRVAFGCYV